MLRTLIKKAAARFGYRIEPLQRDPEFVPRIESYRLTYQGGQSPCSFDFWIATKEADLWYYRWFYEAKRPTWELDEYSPLVKPGSRILEIGSHHGFLTMQLAHLAGQNGFVLGVEANPQNVLIAQAQCTLNDLGPDRVRIILGAGAATSGENLKLAWRTNSHVVLSGSTEQQQTYVVQTITGDALDERFGPFNVLKIDVEGFEASVLEGCRNILARRPVLLLELHPNFMKDYEYLGGLEDVFRLIRATEYEGTTVVRPNFHISLPFSTESVSRDEVSNVHLRPRDS